MSSRKRAAMLLAQAHRDALNRHYIWQSPDWPKLRCDMVSLQVSLLEVRSLQAQLYGLLSSLNMLNCNETQSDNWVHEAQSTAHIEGEILQLHSVRASVARRLGLVDSSKFQDQATEGMLDMLQSALSVAQTKQTVNHELLKNWHAGLFARSESARHARFFIESGQYRSHAKPMQIVTPSSNGKDVVHYIAPPSAQMAAQMDALLAWFNASGTAAWPTDGLVRAALAHLWFEAIHPFEDGNGRLGRALAELALFQDWQSVFPKTPVQRVFSLSQQLWKDRKGYYDALQHATGNGSMDVTPWVTWFVNSVALAMRESMSNIQASLAKAQFWQTVAQATPQLSASQRKVLNKLYDTPDGFKNGLSTELYCTIATCSRATAYRDLTQLLAAGLLTQWGVGRGTRYGLQRYDMQQYGLHKV